MSKVRDIIKLSGEVKELTISDKSASTDVESASSDLKPRRKSSRKAKSIKKPGQMPIQTSREDRMALYLAFRRKMLVSQEMARRSRKVDEEVKELMKTREGQKEFCRMGEDRDYWKNRFAAMRRQVEIDGGVNAQFPPKTLADLPLD